jgi:ectoine hydroxylase-related dioxygenase (phytanoyl-CoA dioxygenase family)
MPHAADSILESVARSGFALAPSLVPRDLIEELLSLCPAVPGAGLRDLFGVMPRFRALAELSAVRSLAQEILGRTAFVTRAILFDKSPDANWALGFHQDVVIAVAARHETPGFGPWSVKAGIDHVRPPASVLERMITVRIHLDPCGTDNAPLAVIPGSHASGFLSDAEVSARIARGPVIECPAAPGDAVLMRPLLLHGSRKADNPSHRRVAHLEFACEELPGRLRWRADS